MDVYLFYYGSNNLQTYKLPQLQDTRLLQQYVNENKPKRRTIMASKRKARSSNSKQIIGHAAPKRKTVSADKVGLSLTISDKALKEFDKIQEKSSKIAEEDRQFSWR